MYGTEEQSFMGGNEANVSDDALSDIAYLGRSRNRVEILGAIVSQPYSPRELTDVTGTARSTLERILAELEERGWANRTPEGQYVATSAGNFVYDEFIPLVQTMEAIETLGEEIAWLPRDELTISLSHFSDATVRHPEDPTEAIDYMAGIIRKTENFRVISNLRPPGVATDPIHDRVRSGQMRFDYVLTRDVLEYLSSHHERRERWLDSIEAGADLWVWEGSIPCNLWIFDDTVWIKNSSPESKQDTYGVPIISDNDTVRSWGHDLIDQYRTAATPVDAMVFAGGSPITSQESDERTPSR